MQNYPKCLNSMQIETIKQLLDFEKHFMNLPTKLSKKYSIFRTG